MAAPVPLPPYAYVPGRTPRHDDAAFSELQASVTEGMTPEELMHSAAWRAGLEFLRQGFHWEAHEVLEPVWMQTRPNSAERHLVQAVIQIANAALKARMQRPRAVLRLCDMAEDHLDAGAAGRERVMGLEVAELVRRIGDLRRDAIL